MAEVSSIVTLWLSRVAIGTEALRDLEGDALRDQATRGKPSLDTNDKPEALGQWQQHDGDSNSASQGMSRSG